MSYYLYVDNSNVWIEGMHVAAVRRGLAPDIWSAQSAKITDSTWKLDFGKLHDFAAGNDQTRIARSILYGTRPPRNDSLWKAAERNGFEVVIYDRNVANREKKIDTTIVRDIMKDSYERMKPGEDVVTLVAGDADYVPAAEDLRNRNIGFEVFFWAHASRELRDVCSKFVPLDEYLDYLAL